MSNQAGVVVLAAGRHKLKDVALVSSPLSNFQEFGDLPGLSHGMSNQTALVQAAERHPRGAEHVDQDRLVLRLS
jgi:hypothetical protein